MTKKGACPSLYHHRISRRGLLRVAGLAAGGALIGRTARLEATAAFFESLPGVPRPASPGSVLPQVALAEADTYELDVIRERVRTLIDLVGGFGDVIKPGDRVAIKTNLTGGAAFEAMIPVKGIESYITHPHVVQALCEAVIDAGAGEVFIVEGTFDNVSYREWGYVPFSRDLEIPLVDLNQTAPYERFTEKTVGINWLVYDRFTFNNILDDVDVFMSVPKLKCHAEAGVTVSMKNLVGLVPMQFYCLDPSDNRRSALHGPNRQSSTRLPSVILDLVRARPIDFALVDGIMTSESSEGPWNGPNEWRPKTANVLIAGKNMVATDAVATAVMGFDPAATSLVEDPFRYCVNHLELAHRFGLGTNQLDEIEIVGDALSDVTVPFRPFGGGRDARTFGPYNNYRA
jgi:uncharacterized protein (DUF362 family)